jgi:hypothetical protein
MQVAEQQPIIIFGGFLSFPMLYNDMRQVLHELTSQPVSVVLTRSYDWLGVVTLYGVSRLLLKLDRAVRQGLATSQVSKITLVCHSAGGVLARLYLSPEPFAGRSYCGWEKVSQLITLGSPHHNQGGLTRGGRISRYADRHCPAACHSDVVAYTTVAGKSLRGSQLTTPQARLAYSVYQDLCGDGAAWGDGVVPVQSALLEGAQQVVLVGVGHSNLSGEPWYGSRDVIPLWWPN